MHQATIQRPVGLLFAGLLGAALASPVWAAASLSSDSSLASASATSGSGAGQQDSELVNGLGSASAASGPISSSAGTTGTLSYGFLTATANGSVADSVGGNNSQISGSGLAQATLRMVDTLTVTSATLNAGDAVNISFELFLDSTVDATGQVVYSSSASAAFAIWEAEHAFDLVNGFFPIQQGQLQNFTSTFGNTATNGLQSVVVNFNTTVGASFDVSLGLGAGVQAEYYQTTNSPLLSSQGSANGSAWFWVSNAGGDFALSSASGFDYTAAPVPEPETYAMLLAGLGLVGFAARRRLNGHAGV